MPLLPPPPLATPLCRLHHVRRFQSRLRSLLTLAAHARARVIVLGLCVRVCVRVSVCLSVCLSVRRSVSTVFLDNRSRFELQMWICFQVGCLDSKLRLELGSPGKRVKRAGSQGECALIRIRGLWHFAPCCTPSKQDRRLVIEPVNDTAC